MWTYTVNPWEREPSGYEILGGLFFSSSSQHTGRGRLLLPAERGLVSLLFSWGCGPLPSQLGTEVFIWYPTLGSIWGFPFHHASCRFIECVFRISTNPPGRVSFLLTTQSSCSHFISGFYRLLWMRLRSIQSILRNILSCILVNSIVRLFRVSNLSIIPEKEAYF